MLYNSKDLGESFPLMWLNISLSQGHTKVCFSFIFTPQKKGYSLEKMFRYHCESNLGFNKQICNRAICADQLPEKPVGVPTTCRCFSHEQYFPE